MTSKERREARYQRRRAKRLAKRTLRCREIGQTENVFGFHDLYAAGKKCCNGVRWKSSVQKFELHLLSGTAKRRQLLLNGTWKQSPYVYFTISERGKTRVIDAPRIHDRQVHKVYTKKVLLPLYTPSMIWNNGASLPGKGFSFSRNELKEDLRHHYRRYGTKGSIILLDFKQFFPSVSHEVIYRRHRELILQSDLRTIGDKIVGMIHGEHGLPLGVEPSQAEMIGFVSPLDNFIKCQLSLKGAGHYMDDYYILVPPDMDAQEILRMVCGKVAKLRLTVNKAKTRIVPLTKPFRYCKVKYRMTETGRVITNGNRDNVKRARKKFRAFYKKAADGTMSGENLWNSVNSIFAYFEGYNDHARVLKLRRLFYSLFGFSPERKENFRTLTV
ncbi:MAG: RNA-directed DNA polymerase [Ruminococcus flavefaciens]|nr:RNA-directed DNA polymerase [Ruminococcus flavefaciens]